MLQVALSLLALLLILVGLALMLHLVTAQRNAVPPVLMPPKALAEVVQALKLPDKGTLVDLGCGDGRVLAAVARTAPDVRLIGVENNPVLFGLAKAALPGTAKLVLGQIEKQDLHQIERVFVYLGPGLMASLEPRFELELPKGARVVSVQFPLPHRRPVKEYDLKYGKPYAKRVYIYDY